MTSSLRPGGISVVIPTYNRATLLRQAISSILAQTVSPAQVLVVDDGSTDSTPEVLQELRPRVQSIRVPQGGKSSALNAGLKEVSGEYVWIFDDDDVAVPDALERFVEPLQADASLGFSYSHYWYTPSLDEGRLAEPRGASKIPDVRARGFLVPLLEFNFLSGASLFARRSCYSEVGEFDPSLTRSQEYDMAIRLARRFRGAQVRGGPTFHLRLHAGPRGSQSDQFTADEKKRKWLEYDQRIFRRVYQELLLRDYLRPGLELDGHRRTAFLQRAVIMANKKLFLEMTADLTAVAADADQSPLRSDEISLVKEGLAGRSFYGGGIRSDPSALAMLGRLSRQSRAVEEVCAHVRTVILRELAGAGRALLHDVSRARWAGTRNQIGGAGRLAMQLVHVSGKRK